MRNWRNSSWNGLNRGLRFSCKFIMEKAEVTCPDMTENNLVDNDDFQRLAGKIYEAKWSVP